MITETKVNEDGVITGITITTPLGGASVVDKKYICSIHGDNPNWTCFESNGGVTHINGEIKQIESTPRIDINAFMQAVFEAIDIGIVIVSDYDLVTYGTIKQLAEKHLGWDRHNKQIAEKELSELEAKSQRISKVLNMSDEEILATTEYKTRDVKEVRNDLLNKARQ